MPHIGISETKKHLTQLITAGEKVIITRYGKPIALLIPIRPTTPRRVPGSTKVKFEVPSSFFEPLPDELLDDFG